MFYQILLAEEQEQGSKKHKTSSGGSDICEDDGDQASATTKAPASSSSLDITSTTRQGKKASMLPSPRYDDDSHNPLPSSQESSPVPRGSHDGQQEQATPPSFQKEVGRRPHSNAVWNSSSTCTFSCSSGDEDDNSYESSQDSSNSSLMPLYSPQEVDQRPLDRQYSAEEDEEDDAHKETTFMEQQSSLMAMVPYYAQKQQDKEESTPSRSSPAVRSSSHRLDEQNSPFRNDPQQQYQKDMNHHANEAMEVPSLSHSPPPTLTAQFLHANRGESTDSFSSSCSSLSMSYAPGIMMQEFKPEASATLPSSTEHSNWTDLEDLAAATKKKRNRRSRKTYKQKMEQATTGTLHPGSIHGRQLHPWSIQRNPTMQQCWLVCIHNEEDPSRPIKLAASSPDEANELGRALSPPIPQSPIDNACAVCRTEFRSATWRKRAIKSGICANCGSCVCRTACRVPWPAWRLPDLYTRSNKNTARVCLVCHWLAVRFRQALLEGNYSAAMDFYDMENINLRNPLVSDPNSNAGRKEEIIYPIHAAIIGGNLQLVQWLTDVKYAPISVPGKRLGETKMLATSIGRRPLQIALEANDWEIACHLVKDGLHRGLSLLEYETKFQPETKPLVVFVESLIPLLSPNFFGHQKQERVEGTLLPARDPTPSVVAATTTRNTTQYPAICEEDDDEGTVTERSGEMDGALVVAVRPSTNDSFPL